MKFIWVAKMIDIVCTSLVHAPTLSSTKEESIHKEKWRYNMLVCLVCCYSTRVRNSPLSDG